MKTPSTKPSPRHDTPPKAPTYSTLAKDDELLYSPITTLDDLATVQLKSKYFDALTTKFQENFDTEVKEEAAASVEGSSQPELIGFFDLWPLTNLHFSAGGILCSSTEQKL
ncbi:hypothetical protein L2E82_38027 [Cichorium intybus]|uniref:Uncharacterized protein n=1 Tax=Cichorium intybus TaxID=13427 RepID=A0ACB9AFF2_CICIN|nr:hypothetical protein L2E82_38027 [Cichorium intybus]